MHFMNSSIFQLGGIYCYTYTYIYCGEGYFFLFKAEANCPVVQHVNAFFCCCFFYSLTDKFTQLDQILVLIVEILEHRMEQQTQAVK